MSIVELRRLSEYCEFGSMLNEIIRDRIVCGIADDRIQRRLLSEPELTFEKAVELSLAIELASKIFKICMKRREQLDMQMRLMVYHHMFTNLIRKLITATERAWWYTGVIRVDSKMLSVITVEEEVK